MLAIDWLCAVTRVLALSGFQCKGSDDDYSRDGSKAQFEDHVFSLTKRGSGPRSQPVYPTHTSSLRKHVNVYGLLGAFRGGNLVERIGVSVASIHHCSATAQ
jgi:hypothetical protein